MGVFSWATAAAENIRPAQETCKCLCKWRPLWAQTVTDGIVYELLRRLFRIGNFCFWVTFFKQLLLKNCVVDFVEIFNICTRKARIKAAKRTFNSDKICCSYCDFYFGVTFFGTQCMYVYSSRQTVRNRTDRYIIYSTTVFNTYSYSLLHNQWTIHRIIARRYTKL